jgi:hypothetical protein
VVKVPNSDDDYDEGGKKGIRAMQRIVRSLNSYAIVSWIFRSVS